MDGARCCIYSVSHYTVELVQVGDKVTKGQVVCIVEAMKLMNEIEVRHSTTLFPS